MKNSFTPSLVLYKGQYYLNYAVTELGDAKLLTTDLLKFSGTPDLNKLEVVKRFLPFRHSNGVNYIMTKKGVISCATGRVTVDKKIVAAINTNIC